MADVGTGVTVTYNTNAPIGDCRDLKVTINQAIIDITHLGTSTGASSLRSYITGDLPECTIVGEFLVNSTFSPVTLYDGTTQTGASLVITATSAGLGASLDVYTFSAAVVESVDITFPLEDVCVATITWKAGGTLALS